MKLVPAALAALSLQACAPSSPRPPVSSSPAASSIPADAMVLTFAWMGGCREGNKEWNRATNPSSANAAQLSRTFSDLVSIAPSPKYLFFPGDLVLGLAADPSVLEGQLAAWTSLYRAHPSGVASKLTFVPMMGNHESLVYRDGDEIPSTTADASFATWLKASGFDARAGNGPTSAPPNLDALADDERSLSYSFDDGPVHFVVLDTDSWTTTPDPKTGTSAVGWIPYHWLAADLDAAQKRPETHAIFVLGHKPLVRPDGRHGREDVIAAALNEKTGQLFDATPKMKGYLTSHDHLWDARRLAGARGVWQVISGNGGSALDAGWTANPPYFGFTVVTVYASGRVVLVPYRRPVPVPYDGPNAEPATPGDPLVIATN
jgi:hypothetical protein